MANSGYFNNIPQIAYHSNVSRNIISRAKIKERVFGSLNAFYPYTVEEGERPDDVAFNYYDDPNLVWLVYLANDIIDPYYDWPLTTRQFVAYMTKTYGTLEAAQAEIIHYKHTDGHIITVDTYTYGGIEAGDYSAVYRFTHELEANEEKRFIKLLDKRFAGPAVENLNRVMNGR